MNYVNDEKLRCLAERHVDWLLSVLRPLLVEEFIHDHKHGRSDKDE